MALFVELEDGSLINLDHAIRIHPKTRSNRIDFITGGHLQLTDSDAEMIRQSLTSPEPRYEQVISREEIQNLEKGAFNGTSEKPEAKPAKRRGRPPKSKNT